MIRFLRCALIAVILGSSLTSSAAAAPPDSAPVPATRPAATQPASRKIALGQFEKMRQDKDAVVLDVRTPKEFAAGHVPGAVNIDWRSRHFNDEVAKLDKSKTYLVHCLGGVRSAAAVKRMSEMDFVHLYDYSGGWAEYEKSGKPVEK